MKKIGHSLAAKLSIATFVVIVLSMSVIGVFSFMLNRDDAVTSRADIALSVAQTIASSMA